MKTLNLTDLDKSDIKYKISKFPDGQQQVTIDPYDKIDFSNYTKGVIIKSRLNNFKDLELIICATKSLRELGVKEIHLYTPYFMGARSDRKFEDGSNNYLKHVICPIINSMGYESVTVLDPHSNILEACLNGFKKVSNYELVRKFSIMDLWSRTGSSGPFFEEYLNNLVLISPDAGATHKIHKLSNELGYKGKVITCNKERDNEGKLSKTIVPIGNNNLKDFMSKDYIIVDDICDGGATFINIAKEIEGGYYGDFKGRLFLIVTHGIFSKGFGELQQYFDGIYCTNSYSDIPEVIPFVKQLNVF